MGADADRAQQPGGPAVARRPDQRRGRDEPRQRAAARRSCSPRRAIPISRRSTRSRRRRCPTRPEQVEILKLAPAFIMNELRVVLHDRLRHPAAVPADRPGRLGDPARARHDDGATRDDLAADQAAHVRADRRLEPGHPGRAGEFQMNRAIRATPASTWCSTRPGPRRRCGGGALRGRRPMPRDAVQPLRRARAIGRRAPFPPAPAGRPTAAMSSNSPMRACCRRSTGSIRCEACRSAPMRGARIARHDRRRHGADDRSRRADAAMRRRLRAASGCARSTRSSRAGRPACRRSPISRSTSRLG